jgi:hypothetical protein
VIPFVVLYGLCRLFHLSWFLLALFLVCLLSMFLCLVDEYVGFPGLLFCCCMGSSVMVLPFVSLYADPLCLVSLLCGDFTVKGLKK